MKIITVLVTAVTLLSFGSATFACEGMRTKQQTTANTDDAPILPPSKTS